MSRKRTTPYRFRFTPSAERELEHEMEYSAKQWGKRHATSYRRGLYQTIERILMNPFACPEHPAIGKGYRLLRYKGNRIVYRVNESERYVEIMGFPSVYRSTENH